MASFLMLKNRLAILVVLFSCYYYLGDFTVSARQFRPGFVYTRNTGRCTPQYWSSRRESWPKMVPLTSTVSKIFGSRAYERYRYDLTLLEAAARNDDMDNIFARLVKQSTAALLNSYARKNYPYSAWEVKTMLIQALVSDKSAAILAQQLSEVNEACN
ncbi:uncharacterized protein LOC132626723 [Lycium barbarum]|uniref:uncharacterized protein LOC132626723 n=1 Tax=Lycium barbarum TaxID=112863 RepID=UPI00293E15F5|nr:uncharacterized protein LOC132626723 [Lycium barbarum]